MNIKDMYKIRVELIFNTAIISIFFCAEVKGLKDDQHEQQQ